MTSGSPLRILFSFALPLMVGNVFQQLYTLVDSMVVGKVLGLDALAAVGNGEWLNWLVLSLIQDFAQGFSIRLAQDFGAAKIRRIHRGVHTGAVVGVATAALISAVMFLFGRQIVGAFISGSPKDAAATIEIAYHYLCIMAAFLPVLYLLHIYRSSLQGLGDTVMPMVSGGAEFVLRTLSILLLPKLIGNEGLFWAEVLAWAGADAVLLPSYYVRMARIRKAYTAKSIE